MHPQSDAGFTGFCRHEDWREVELEWQFFADVWGKEGIFPEIFAPKSCQFDVIEIFFIQLASLCTVAPVVRS